MHDSSSSPRGRELAHALAAVEQVLLKVRGSLRAPPGGELPKSRACELAFAVNWWSSLLETTTTGRARKCWVIGADPAACSLAGGVRRICLRISHHLRSGRGEPARLLAEAWPPLTRTVCTLLYRLNGLLRKRKWSMSTALIGQRFNCRARGGSGERLVSTCNLKEVFHAFLYVALDLKPGVIEHHTHGMRFETLTTHDSVEVQSCTCPD